MKAFLSQNKKDDKPQPSYLKRNERGIHQDIKNAA